MSDPKVTPINGHRKTQSESRRWEPRRAAAPPSPLGPQWATALYLSLVTRPNTYEAGLATAARLLDYDVEGLIVVQNREVTIEGVWSPLRMESDQLVELIASLCRMRVRG